MTLVYDVGQEERIIVTLIMINVKMTQNQNHTNRNTEKTIHTK